MSEESPSCPLCTSPQALRVGRIRDGDCFAGRVCVPAIAGGELWRCTSCDSLFKAPVLAATEYDELYAQGRAEQWAGSGERRDFRLIRELLLREPQMRAVLDVGCGTGDFLATLPDAWVRCGVEPSAAAATQARRRGLDVPATDLAALPAEAAFDAITLLDVIEHLVRPAAQLEAAWIRLRPGGLLVISTGDPDCGAWRLFGARFWYAIYPEHLLFPSQRFFEQWVASRAAVLTAHGRFVYRDLALPLRLAGVLLQAAYAASPAALDAAGYALGWLRRKPVPRRRHFAPGVPGTFRDHQLIALRKVGCSMLPLSRA